MAADHIRLQSDIQEGIGSHVGGAWADHIPLQSDSQEGNGSLDADFLGSIDHECRPADGIVPGVVPDSAMRHILPGRASTTYKDCLHLVVRKAMVEAKTSNARNEPVKRIADE
eukprot:5524726-Pyramimonas_sp.AAC.1